MKSMNTLTAIIFAAAIVPALAMSSTLIADEHGPQHKASGDQQSEHLTSAKPAGSLYADDVIGKTVKNRQSGDDVGEIRDLIIGANGRVLGAVVATGGFLGMGGREVSLGWNRLEHVIEDEEIMFYVNIDEEALKNAQKHSRK